jgi:hypothetical protein
MYKYSVILSVPALVELIPTHTDELHSYVVFQTDYFNVNKGGYIKFRTVTVTVMEPWLAISHQNDY